MKSRSSAGLVFGTSAAVLVLEIVAGRIMAPYVGISLETFTGIIGTVLAGIAIGAAVGGWAADVHDPRRLIGPGLVTGGVLTWLSLPIVRAMGPLIGSGALAIVALTTMAFFLPAAVLSAIAPMVAKLRLRSLDDTGAVVGGLSAWGTAGALVGTFLTGFVLLSAASTRTIVVVLGGVLVAVGLWAWVVLGQTKPSSSSLAVVAVLAAGPFVTEPPCDHETEYFCVRIVADPAAPSGRSLFLDQLRHAYVDLDDPTHLDVRYIRLFAAVAAAQAEPPERVLHVGGGGFSFPRYLYERSDSTESLVLEIDAELVTINQAELGLVLDERLQARTGDARLALERLDDDQFDLVVGDAFGGQSVPWHLTTAEFLAEVDRVMTPDGIYVMNVIDGGESRFARAELATLAAQFEHVAVILPPGGLRTGPAFNQVLVASHEPLPVIDVDPADGVVRPGPIGEYIDGQRPLRDDFAPVDQLLP